MTLIKLNIEHNLICIPLVPYYLKDIKTTVTPLSSVNESGRLNSHQTNDRINLILFRSEDD